MTAAIVLVLAGAAISACFLRLQLMARTPGRLVRLWLVQVALTLLAGFAARPALDPPPTGGGPEPGLASTVTLVLVWIVLASSALVNTAVALVKLARPRRGS